MVGVPGVHHHARFTFFQKVVYWICVYQRFVIGNVLTQFWKPKGPAICFWPRRAHMDLQRLIVQINGLEEFSSHSRLAETPTPVLGRVVAFTHCTNVNIHLTQKYPLQPDMVAQKYPLQPGSVAHACHPRTEEAEASWSYIASLSLRWPWSQRRPPLWMNHTQNNNWPYVQELHDSVSWTRGVYGHHGWHLYVIQKEHTAWQTPPPHHTTKSSYAVERNVDSEVWHTCAYIHGYTHSHTCAYIHRHTHTYIYSLRYTHNTHLHTCAYTHSHMLRWTCDNQNSYLPAKNFPPYEFSSQFYLHCQLKTEIVLFLA